DIEDEGEIEKEGEWTDDEQPLDWVDVREDLVYETLIEKMTSCSLNFDFRTEKGDPSNLKIPCMIGDLGIFGDDEVAIVGDMLYGIGLCGIPCRRANVEYVGLVIELYVGGYGVMAMNLF
nr:hypothetical protein [Tanacetum cinerariifolium]